MSSGGWIDQRVCNAPARIGLVPSVETGALEILLKELDALCPHNTFPVAVDRIPARQYTCVLRHYCVAYFDIVRGICGRAGSADRDFGSAKGVRAPIGRVGCCCVFLDEYGCAFAPGIRTVWTDYGTINYDIGIAEGINPFPAVCYDIAHDMDGAATRAALNRSVITMDIATNDNGTATGYIYPFTVYCGDISVNGSIRTSLLNKISIPAVNIAYYMSGCAAKQI